MVQKYGEIFPTHGVFEYTINVTNGKKGRSVVVTGGAGFIGSHLVDRLIVLGHRVTVIDDLSAGLRKHVNPRAAFVKMDIRSSRLGAAFRRFRPAAVFHLAAQKNLRTSADKPLFDADVNIMGSLNVIECSRRYGVRTLVFASSAAVYGEAARVPTPETWIPDPVTPYGIAKHAVDRYLGFFGAASALRTVSLRYANVYGPRQDAKGEAGVVAIFAQRLIRGKPLVVNGTGGQTRDYVYVDDVVSANVAAMRTHVRGTFNVGTGRQTSVNALASAMLRTSRADVPIRHGPAVPGDVLRSALESAHARRQLRWKSTVPLSEGLKRTLSWIRSNDAGRGA